MLRIDTGEQLRRFLDDHQPLELALWDFDGVVVDSEPLHAETYRQILARLGCTPAHDFFEELAGRTEPAIWSELIERFQLTEAAADLREERLALVTERLAQVSPNWFVIPALERLESNRVASRIVSAGNASVIHRYIEAQGLVGRFQEVTSVAADGSSLSKAERLAHLIGGARRVLLIEDSDRYLEIGHSHGAVTLAVRHSVNASRSLNANALLHGSVGR